MDRTSQGEMSPRRISDFPRLGADSLGRESVVSDQSEASLCRGMLAALESENSLWLDAGASPQSEVSPRSVALAGLPCAISPCRAALAFLQSESAKRLDSSASLQGVTAPCRISSVARQSEVAHGGRTSVRAMTQSLAPEPTASSSPPRIAEPPRAGSARRARPPPAPSRPARCRGNVHGGTDAGCAPAPLARIPSGRGSAG